VNSGAGIRLQKFLAEAGVASRRAAEKLIVAGEVTVNGEVVSTLGSRVDPARDEVRVKGAPVRAKRKLIVALNKPPGVLCTRRDEAERSTVLDLLPAEWQGLYPVGRLDRDSEGLLLLTNDGELCLRLTHPRFQVRKHYTARVVGKLSEPELLTLRRGVRHDGETLRAAATRLISANASHSVVELVLTEGRNREVRRMFEALGYAVEGLRRTQIGPIKLGELKPGRWRVLTESEIASLRRLTAD
jgi:pseudouridine synthase